MSESAEQNVSVAGWGNFPRLTAPILRPRNSDEAQTFARDPTELIARGNGRSYGDASLNAHCMESMLRLDRFLHFDPVTGMLECEAGVMLIDIIDIFLPRGWFPAVTPGTAYVTVGGMIAADVHGKNHHAVGCFGQYVDEMTLLLASGDVIKTSSALHSELFAATCGGMGLTGVILSAKIRLQRLETAYLRQETHRAENLRDVMRLFHESSAWSYTVAWIDCIARDAKKGRSLFYRAEHAVAGELNVTETRELLQSPKRKTKTMPRHLPALALNRYSIALFNHFYYQHGKPGTSFVPYDRFFYPLDGLLAWNRMYGKAGFVQYQCVLPKAASEAGMAMLLGRIAENGGGSFLAVLKLLGSKPGGMLSFPMEGYTLALDFAASSATFSLLRELDAIVLDHGGRLYLAKDAIAGQATLRHYPQLEAFRNIKRHYDPGNKFQSLLSQRLGI